MKTFVIKRSMFLNGHKTSVSLEDEFWNGLREIADRDHLTVASLVQRLDDDRENVNLSSAIRAFVFNRLRSRMESGVANTGASLMQISAK